MKFKPLGWGFCISILVSCSMIHAASLSLTEAQKRLVDAVVLRAQQKGIEVASANVRQSKRWANPHLQLEKDLNDNLELTLEQPFNLSNKFSVQQHIAQSNFTRQQLQYLDLFRQQRFLLNTLFYKAVLLQPVLETYGQNIQVLESLLTISKKNLHSRFIVLSEVLRIQSLLANLRNEELEYKKDYQETVTTLGTLLGLSPTQSLTLKPELALDSLLQPTSVSLEQCLQTAKQQRPDWLLAQESERLEILNLHFQQSLAMPEFSGGLHFSKAGSTVPNNTLLTLGFDLPIFDQNQDTIRAFEKNVDQHTLEKKWAEVQLEKEVVLAYTDLKNCDSALSNLDPKLTENYRRLLGLTSENYQKRLISILEFSDFIESYRDSVIQTYQVVSKRLVAAETLQLAVGIPILQSQGVAR